MTNHTRHYLKIYKHRAHVWVTAAIVALPFLFMLLSAGLSWQEKIDFLEDLGTSTVRLIAAFAVSVAIAALLGITLSRGKVGNFFLPVFDVLQSFPTFAMLPLALRWFGASEATILYFLILTMMWPILFAIISSQKLIKAEWEEAATIFGANGWKRLVYFALPIAYPGLITGAIVGLGEGWEAVVGGEIIVHMGGPGLGRFFDGSNATGMHVFYGVTALLLFIFVMNKFIWLPLLERSHKIMTE